MHGAQNTWLNAYHTPCKKMHMHPYMRDMVRNLLCHGNYCELILSLARASCRLQVFRFVVAHLSSSNFWEINFLSHLGEEWPQNPQLSYINPFDISHRINQKRDWKSSKVAVTSWPGRSLKIIIPCRFLRSKYAIWQLNPTENIKLISYFGH